MDDKLKETNELLTELIKTRSLWYRFLSGLLQALGATLGLAIIIAILAFTISKIQLIPIIGGWLSQVVNEALSNVKLPQQLMLN